MWTTLPLMFALAFLPPHGASAAAQDDPNARPYHRGIVAQLSRRTVKGRVLTSPATPAARIEFDKKFKYVGSQDFILYGVARAEQHFFVEADESGRVRRLYWVQFEGYLPDNTHTYDYESAKTVRLGPFDFFADLLALNIKNNPSRPDSDGARAQSFLESKGFRMAG
ncbi:MAG TPA: hypothetical protein VFX96_02555, partial [Pyrinomonadaceae bacterium]|nr:hypothetical protein [Pyrinomonadaceae bacterium]